MYLEYEKVQPCREGLPDGVFSHLAAEDGYRDVEFQVDKEPKINQKRP